MEHSISSLTFKGSISEAILEAKNQKKLFVVYISGGDAESAKLETSTWSDSKVAESISKYCILLHILEGSPDAAQFSALYPQNSVPSMTAVGYNGIKLWQSDGFISSEVLASNLEKAWLSLHIQETTATFLTAALASQKTGPAASGVSDTPTSGQGSSAGVNVPALTVDNHLQCSINEPLNSSEREKNRSHEVEKKVSEDQTRKTVDAEVSESNKNEQSLSFMKDATGSTALKMVDSDNFRDDHKPFQAEENTSSSGKIVDDHPSSSRDSQLAAVKANEAVLDKKNEVADNKRTSASENSVKINCSDDVYLNIRLPNGVCLQEKFSVASTLRMVKDFVERNQASSIGSYVLAIPYPRRVFGDEDLSKSLSDLGLLNRQSIIVVPPQTENTYRGSSSSDQTYPTDAADDKTESGGYLGYVKRFISFLNPFSYIGGDAGSSSEQQSQASKWQYGPNATLQNIYGTRRDSSNSQNLPTSADGRNSGKSGRMSARFGSNIHTLKHDEDDGLSGDRNAFWNGNSTQYGGDNDKR